MYHNPCCVERVKSYIHIISVSKRYIRAVYRNIFLKYLRSPSSNNFKPNKKNPRLPIGRILFSSTIDSRIRGIDAGINIRDKFFAAPPALRHVSPASWLNVFDDGENHRRCDGNQAWNAWRLIIRRSNKRYFCHPRSERSSRSQEMVIFRRKWYPGRCSR